MNRKLIYIAGDGRSGSTLLDSVLNNLDDSISIGELSRFWTRYLEGKSNCGCGDNIRICILWGQIVKELDAKFEMSLAETEKRIIEIRLFKNFKKIDDFIKDSNWREFCDLVSYVYQRIFELTNSQIVIDSSKYPSWGYFLFKLNIGDFYFIHLERNLAEVANSWKKTKLLPEYDEQIFMPIKSNYTIFKSWMKIKFLCNRIRKIPNINYLYIEYEKLCKDQNYHLLQIEQFIQEVFLNRNFEFKSNHAIGGNPMRIQSKTLIIKDSKTEFSNLSFFESQVFEFLNKFSKFIL